MKKGYSFIRKPAHFFSRLLPLIFVIGFAVTWQSFALNYVQRAITLAKPLKAYLEGNVPTSTSSNLRESSKAPVVASLRKSRGGVRTVSAEGTECLPISTLPCDQVNVSLPFNLTFSGTEGGLIDTVGAGTGFTMVDAYSNATRATADGPPSSAVKGYEPSRLKIKDNKLNIKTNAGIAYQTVNNQLNTLGVGVAPANYNKLVIETTLINPFAGDKAQQGGLWFGLNDQTFIKLVVSNNAVEMRKEVGNATVATAGLTNKDHRITSTINSLNTSIVRLRLVIDFMAGVAEGFYSTDGIVYSNVGATYKNLDNLPPISISNMGLSGKTNYAGIFATHRNGTAPVVFSFENFSVKNEIVTPVAVPFRLNAGGGERTIGSTFYNADNYFFPAPGVVSNTVIEGFSGTSSPELYYDRRFGAFMNYNIPVANGKYTVKLHMSEGFYSAAGSRVFDVVMEGTTVLDDFDLVVAGNSKNKIPVVREFTVDVINNYLDIYFIASKENAIVNAIEILPINANTAPVFASQAYNFPVDETLTVSAPVGAVTATDAQSDGINYSITAGNEAGKFSINNEGKISLIAALDYATASIYNLTVQATDNGSPNLSATVPVVIKVNKVAGNKPPVVAAEIQSQNAIVNTLFTFAIPANTFSDPDGNALTLTASLKDGTSLPQWLSFDGTTFSGAPTTAGVYLLKVTANDGAATVYTEFSLNITTAPTENQAPVIIASPEAQPLTGGQAFSFKTGSFSDPDAGDVLTYTASLSNNNVLPAWLKFDAATQTFSGTAPTQASMQVVRITATDKAGAKISGDFLVNVEPAAPVVVCSPISILPCPEIGVTLPYLLNFTSNEGGLADKNGAKIGFTMVDAPSSRLTADGSPTYASVPGYEPGKLLLDPAGTGKLSISTTQGISFLRNGSTSTTTTNTNSQLNALGVGVETANQDVVIETTLLQPSAGTNNSEQAGLWFGLDEDNFVKLVVVSAAGGKSNIEIRREINGASVGTGLPDQAITAQSLTLNTLNTIVKLKLLIKRGQAAGANGTIQGVYSINDGPEVSLATLALPASFTAGKTIGEKNLSFAGIYASQRRATNSLTFTFEDFSVKPIETPSVKTLAFLPTALDFSAVQGGTVEAKSTVLSASQGTPAITLSQTSASWLTLPDPKLGTITFGTNNFSSTMAPGIYETVVTATADGYEPANLIINLTVTAPPVANELKVNFQDPNTIPPTGWLRDYGQAFGLRTGQYQGESLEYGWKRRSDGTNLNLAAGGTTPGNGRNRNANLNPDIDVLQATLMHMQANNITSSVFSGTPIEGYWEVKVANGQYDVTVSAGDGTINPDPETHSLNVEGVAAITKFTPTGVAGSSTRFKSNKVRVTVTDGFLTINADGGVNTKINSVHIVPVDVKPYLLWSASTHSLVIEKGTNETNKTFSLDLSNSGSQEDLPVVLSATYSEGASNWLSFDATHNNSEPNVTFDFIAAKNLPEGTYTATVLASAQGYSSASTLIQLTVVAPGSIQPYVISSTPANGATNVSVNTVSIAANNLYVPEVAGFKGGVNNETLNANTVKVLKISGGSSSQIPGVVQGTGGGDAISFSPSFALEPNSTYKFVITNEVKAHSGAAFLPYEATFTTGSATVPNGPINVEFTKQTIPGTTGKKYTSLTFGPDGRFYALRLDGVIERYEVNRETGMLSSMVEIKSLTSKYGARSAVGFTFDPASTATNLIAWVSHCSFGLNNAPEFDGNLSKLSGTDLVNEELIITKLPRSKADHLVNSIAFGPDGALYFNQGSNSSMGSYDGTWQRDESLLAATVLRLDIKKLPGTLPLDVRTTANQSLINNAPSDNIRMSDGTYNPYASNSPLTIYASGVRNAFDLVWHSNGQLYVPANGSAAGGNSPASVVGTRRPNGTTYNGPTIPATTSIQVQNDWLFRVNPLKPVGYYGHPNPLRGEYVANRGRLDNTKYPADMVADVNYRGAAYNFELNKSPNGVIEYKSNNFNGALKGKILVCRFSGGSDIIVLEPGSMEKDPSVNSATDDDKIYDIVRASTGSGTNGLPGLGGFTNPLDITEDVQTGNLYVIEYNWNNASGKTSQITLLKATTPTTVAGITTVSPAEIVDNDVVGGEAGKSHTITVANTGHSNLQVTGIVLDGLDKSQFQLVGAQNPTPSAPVSIAPNSAITFNVVFAPTTTGVKTGKIVVTSIGNPQKEVDLSGLGTSGLGGDKEPSLQQVLDVHQIKVNAGDDNKLTNIIHSSNFKAPLLGEEVAIQQFVRAEDGPVTIKPLSVFGPQDASKIVTAFGWYTSGNPESENELFTVDNTNFQTVNVKTTGSLSFDPGVGSFGFYSRWPFFGDRHLYSEDALNTFTGAVPHHVRVYPLKNENGTLVQNAYIIATEEHTSGFDYQDVVVLVSNVKPYTPPVAKELHFSNESIAFNFTPGVPTPAQTVTLAASTGTPAVTLTQSEGSNQWLTLPSAGLGALNFSVKEANLSPGTYNATVTASAVGYKEVTLAVNLVVQAAPSSALISVKDKELIFDGVKNVTVTKRITIANTGTEALSLESLQVIGANAGKFNYKLLTLEGEDAGNIVEPDHAKTVEVSFVPADQVGTFNAVLEINSNAANSPKLSLGLFALSLNGYEGNNEPPLAQVISTLGYKINVGWTSLADGTSATLKGEEVAIPLFEKAGEEAVTITPVARYSPNQQLPFGFYKPESGSPVRQYVGTLSGVVGQHQALFPQIVAGSNQFDPETGAFGIYVQGLQNRLSYTEDQLNAGGPALHVVRTYPLKDRAGALVPNSYLICFEDASNGDYQDYVFVLSNVIPAGKRKTLAFDLTTLNFNVPVSGTTPAKTVILSAANGTPAAVTFTKSANSNWLVLPNPALGNVSIGVNTAGLAVGSYSATITASATDFSSAQLTVNLQVSNLSANAVKINFQLASSATPEGYLSDTGLGYTDAKGYGWVNPTTKVPKDHTASMRERTATGVEARLRTLALMQGTATGQTPGSWEYKVSPGLYNITISAGDPSFFDSNHQINAEGTPVITNFTPTAQDPFRIVTTTINVTDGMLTLDATGGTNSKINFVIIDPATTEGDFISPVASVQVKGTLESPGIYRNQATITINASDAGGSGLDQVLYSINNAPFKEYFGPVVINTAGTYSFRAQAIDGNKNEVITKPENFSILKPELSNTSMVVENLDKFPANDRLVFSLIQTPWRRSNEDGTFTPYNRNHDVVKMRISNKGSGALTVNSLSLSNPSGWKVAQVNNTIYDPVTAAPITVNPGSSVDVSIQFIAQFTSGRVRILNDTLHIASNDDLNPKKKIVLHGLWQARGEGGNEPHAQEIINAFGFKTRTGLGSSDGGNQGTSIIPNTDEILSQFFVRADASKPAYAIQMGAYHGCCASTESFQWFAQNSTSNSTIFNHHALDGQSLLPMRSGTAVVLAEGNFTPNVPFGLKASGSYTDRTRNSEGKIGLRVYKAIDPNGNVIPNAYIFGHDYIGQPTVTNFDYQDNVYFVSNIKPADGPVNYSELAAAPSAQDFGSAQLNARVSRTITLNNLGKVYTSGSDPSITIKSVELVGENISEFTVSKPVASTIAPQGSTTINVVFRPASQGIKNAALLIHYNNSLSPLRIPLYGIGNNTCTVLTAVKRIKGGADANVTIAGNVWEADKAYRQGSWQLDKPVATPIAGTEDDVLYQTYLSATADLAETRYQVTLPNGAYQVRLHFVENFFTTAGSRVFSVGIEGQTRLANFDIFREVGYKAAIVKDFDVSVTDGKLDLKFNPSANRVALAGVEIFAPTANPNAVALTQVAVTGAECTTPNGAITLGVTNSAATAFLYKLGENGSYQTSPVFENLAIGSYVFYVKENVPGGCETSKSFTIPARENSLAFEIDAPLVTCENATGTATVKGIVGGSGNYTITWNTNPVQTGTTATGLVPGVYTVTVQDIAGCSKSQEVTINRDQNCTVTAIRINSAGTAYTTTDNRQFIADKYYGGIDRVGTPVTGDITNTVDDVLYRTERSATSFNYAIPMPNGNVEVILHFAEIYFTAAGKRMFNVDIEGSRKLTNYDVFAKAGGARRAVQEKFVVVVTDGIVNINFTSGAFNIPKVSAIEVIANRPIINSAPVLATIGNKTLTIGDPVSFTANATDENANQTKTFSLVESPNQEPTGATIDPVSGIFYWLPAKTGVYTLTVKVTDNGSPALSDEEQITVTVKDVVVNQSPVLAAIGNKAATVGQVLNFTATATDTDAGQKMQFSLQNAPQGAVIDPATGVFTWTPATVGEYTFTVKVTDDGSPAKSAEEQIKVTVGEINQAPVLAAIGNKSLIIGETLNFTASATDVNTAQTKSFSLVDGPNNASIDEKTGSFIWTPLAIGTFTFKVKVTDNGSPVMFAEETITVTVHEVNQAPVLADIKDITTVVGELVSFTATATDVNENQTKVFSLIDAPATATIDAQSGLFQWTSAAIGTFTFKVKVTDNGSPVKTDEQEVTITVHEKNVEPVLATIGNKEVILGQIVSFTATASDANTQQQLSFSLKNAPAEATIDVTTGAFNWTPATIGTYTFTVVVADDQTPALSDEEQITVTVTEANQVPVLAEIGNKEVLLGQTLTFTAKATDANPSQTLSFSLADAPAGASINAQSGEFSWKPIAVGVYTFKVKVTDNGVPVKSAEEVITVTVSEENLAPVLAEIANQTIIIGQIVTFEAKATDANSAQDLTFSLVDAPSGATIDKKGAFQWTPTVTGTFTFKVKVTDNGVPAMSDSKEITITVKEINVAPILVNIGNKEVVLGEKVTFTATASDANTNQQLTYSLKNAPEGATIDAGTGDFIWNPGAVGTYTFIVVVADDQSPALLDEEQITITVNEANLAPVLAEIGNKAVLLGQTLTFTAVATDGNSSQTLLFSLEQGPIGASINPESGEFSWKPTALGTFTLKVKVTDNGKPVKSAEEVITVLVSKENLAPVMAEIPDQTITIGQTVTFEAKAIDTDPEQELTFSLVGAPSEATIEKTGVFQWKPAAIGTFTFKVKVTDNGSPVMSNEQEVTITVNEVNVAPELATIANQTVNVGEPLTFTVMATDANIGQTKTFSLIGAPEGILFNAASGDLAWTPSRSGIFTFKVVVSDNGSPVLSDEELITITVKEVVTNVAPILATIGDKAITIGQSVIFTAQATDADAGQIITYSLVEAPVTAVINSASGSFQWTPTTVGVYSFLVRATDNGSPIQSDEEKITITVNDVANQAPVLTAIGNKMVSLGQTLSFTASATDANTNQTKLFSLINGPGNAVLNATSGDFIWKPASSGTFTFTIRVTDNGSPVLFDEEKITVTVQEVIVNQAPVLATIGNKTVARGQLLSFTAAATDVNAGQTKTFSLVNAPAGATINAASGAFSWTPATAGTYTFTVRVADNGSPVMSDEEPITVTVTNTSTATALRINSGGTAFLASNNRQFIADAYFGGVNRVGSTTTSAIANTVDDKLYQTERSSSAFTYSIPVNGTVNVVLHFAEIYFTAAGKRMFNVDIEGSRKLTNYDVFAKAGGAKRAVQETFQVTVTDGTLNINFYTGAANMPKVSAIEVLPTTPVSNQAPVLATIGNKTVARGQLLSFTAAATDVNAGQTKTFSLVNAPAGATINAASGAFSWTPATAGTYTFTVRVADNGSPVMSDEEQITVTVTNTSTATALRINSGGTAFLASNNRQFIADAYYGGVNRVGSTTTSAIANTVDDKLYQTERSSSAFTYSIPVNGTVNVVLHFAEIYFTATGKRMFNVDIEGSRKLTNYDVFAKAGGAKRAVQETFQVTVTDGTLNINFSTGAANMPKVSAIEVLPQTGTMQASRTGTAIGLDTDQYNGEKPSLAMYPNPNPGDKVAVELHAFAPQEEVALTLFDLRGRAIKTLTVVTDEYGSVKTSMEFTTKLSTGDYILVAVSKTKKLSGKLLVW